MKILLDECLPKRLAYELRGHEVRTAQEMGWSSLSNGELLTRLSGMFSVFITIDQNLVYQQNLALMEISLIVLGAKSNRFEDIEPSVPEILSVLKTIGKGQIVRIET